MPRARVLLTTIVAVGVLGGALVFVGRLRHPRRAPTVPADDPLPPVLARESFRAIAGRLSGVFSHAAFSPGRAAAVSADARIAIARFDARANDNHARGIARLLSGQLDEAIRLLDAAAVERPSA